MIRIKRNGVNITKENGIKTTKESGTRAHMENGTRNGMDKREIGSGSQEKQSMHGVTDKLI